MCAGAVKNPARPANAFAKLAVMKCTRSDRPSAAQRPAPPGPCVPSECDSSTKIMQSPCSATSTIFARGQRAPVVLYTESTTTIPAPCLAIIRAKCAGSLCRNAKDGARAACAPSHNDACAKVSRYTGVFASAMACSKPTLAENPDWQINPSSFPTHAAKAVSSERVGCSFR